MTTSFDDHQLDDHELQDEQESAMAPLPDITDQLTGEDRAGYERMLASRRAHGVGLYGPYTVLLHNVPLAERIEHLGSFYKFESGLPRRTYQLVVLAFAGMVGSEFEWKDHVPHARAAGIGDDVIDALHRGDRTALDDDDATVLACVDAAMAYRSLPEGTQARAIELLGTDGLLEVVTLAGFYSMIAAVNACFDVSLDTAGKQ